MSVLSTVRDNKDCDVKEEDDTRDEAEKEALNDQEEKCGIT